MNTPPENSLDFFDEIAKEQQIFYEKGLDSGKS